ncbi:MAG: hypothetical protein GY779_01810, partial [Gammaproteobacteria bacterium]|nr:hypothetical protein [Gammaproteobacteria bacterium]
MKSNYQQPFVPGIAVLSGDFLRSGTDPRSLLLTPPENGVALHTPHCSDWLSAVVCTRLTQEQACYTDSGGITILFDGYLSDIVGADAGTTSCEQPARAIAELYRAHGHDAFRRLRGSYSILVLDAGNSVATIVSDRLGSRPTFYRKTDHGVAIAPTVYALSRLTGTRADIDPSSVIEFTITGAFRGTHTLFTEICKLPQAGMLALGPQHCEKVERYWCLSFEPQQVSQNELIDECDALLKQAVQRSMSTCTNAVLGLSGGLDSRVVLGYLRSNGYSEIPVTSFWKAGTQGDDSIVARSIGETLGLAISSFIIDLEDFADTAGEAVLKADCAAEVIDSSPLTRLWRQLGQQFDCFINGDESFGWRDATSSIPDALTKIGWFHLDQAPRVGDWIRPDIAHDLRKEIDRRLTELVVRADQTDPNDLKDKLYYEQRLGNKINAFAVHRLYAMEQARPLMDEDVIDFVSHVPRYFREDKRLLRETFRQKFPDLDRLPYSCKDSIPVPDSFCNMIERNPKMRQFFEANLIE